MAAAKKKPDFYRIKSKGESFRRAGLAFTREGVVVDGNYLTDAQKEAIAKEPSLIVEPIDETEASESEG